MTASNGMSKAERLFRSPWFWLAIIFIACEYSSLVQGNGFAFRLSDFGLMICYSFIFIISLPKFFGFDTTMTNSGMIQVVTCVTGSILYLTFAFTVRLLPRRFIFRASLTMLLIVVLTSAGCTAWVMSWHR